MKFVDPRNDIAFKKIFGNENKKEILISFLNNILNFSGTTKEIIDITIKNPYQVPRLDCLKESILDIMAIDKRGIHYIVEMQVIHTHALDKRIMYYTSKAYCQQLEKAEDYPKLNQVIFLGFLDFTFFEKNPSYASRHLILDVETKENHFQDFELYFVELPKFTKNLDQLENVKEKWIYFVKNASSMKMVPKEMKEPKEIRQAFEVANRFGWSKDELDIYDYIGMQIQDERGRIEQAKIEGIAEGKTIGLEEGKRIGKDEGKVEKSLEVAKAMLTKGMPLDVISEISGLEVKEVETLKQEIT
ncbi:MAG: Rpn family recombination-promoting nuclease/putative transposase [Candidatus Omnitrophota bacterium]